MLHYTVVFFVLAMFAALLGFSSVAAVTAGVGKGLFVLFLTLAAVALVLGLRRGRSGSA